MTLAPHALRCPLHADGLMLPAGDVWSLQPFVLLPATAQLCGAPHESGFEWVGSLPPGASACSRRVVERPSPPELLLAEDNRSALAPTEEHLRGACRGDGGGFGLRRRSVDVPTAPSPSSEESCSERTADGGSLGIRRRGATNHAPRYTQPTHSRGSRPPRFERRYQAATRSWAAHVESM